MSKENKKYWKSLSEYNKTNSSISKNEDEFMEGVTDDFNPSEMSGISRRNFLALLSASAAFAATACSDYHDQKEIVPYTKRPEDVLPGKPNFYASTCNGCSEACGILIKTREGRPIKVDGNNEHPINKGKLCAKGQSIIYDLYDPSRLQTPLKGNRKTNWNIADSEIINKLKEAVEKNKRIAIVSGQINSPTEQKILNDFQQMYPTAEVYNYEVFNNSNRKSAWYKSYNTTELPAIKWEKANIILALESDFLGNEGSYIENTRLYSSRRDITKQDNFNRLYVVEGGMSLTGMNADYRLRLKPDAQLDFIFSLLNDIAIKYNASEIKINSKLEAQINKHTLDEFAKNYGLDSIKLSYLVDDLIQNKGECIVYAGDALPESVHSAVNLLNEVLGNINLYNFESAYIDNGKLTSYDKISELINSYNNGGVDVVIHYDVNPVFHFPSSLGYKEALDNVQTVVSLVDSLNESSVTDHYTLPINHVFESWGDAHFRKNVYSLRQPVIAPLYNTRQREAILLKWLQDDQTVFTEDIYHKYLKENFRLNVYDKKNLKVDFESFWFSALHDGYVNINKKFSAPKEFNGNALFSKTKSTNGNSYSVLLKESYFIGDGRFANNGWLQELPHPVSKVTWDNYAAISPKTAKELNVEIGSVVKIINDDVSVELPVMVQPGVSEKLISIELGYGRSIVGDVGKNVGVNANILINPKNGNSPLINSNIIVEKTDKSYELISTQEHHAIDDNFVKDFHLKRGIIREATLEEFKKDPDFVGKDDHPIFNITREHEFTEMKWAMAIDMNKCVSCASCVASCNVENNVPVVGKDQVAVGREMQWMRIDRYYSGTPEDPIVSNQPMLCQHCDNAPCENVCPVNATNHSPDGLNQMVYNRCVGTRYCANNCPYKVRRFNFFNFRDHFEDAYYENEVTPLVNNPEVTVRSRGVMEKCTFCVQKISEARSLAIQENREVGPDEVITACQQACPAEAIVFGDANDPNSVVSKYREHKLGYDVLHDLNVRPNVTYLAKLRNTHTEDI